MRQTFGSTSSATRPQVRRTRAPVAARRTTGAARADPKWRTCAIASSTGHHSVRAVLGRQLVDRLRRTKARGALRCRIPRRVRDRVVQQVGAELFPRGSRSSATKIVVGCLGARQGDVPGFTAQRRALVAVGVAELVAVGLREKPSPKRAARRAAATDCPPHAIEGPPGVIGGGRRRGHRPPRSGTRVPASASRRMRRCCVGPPRPITHRDAVERELLRPVTQPEDVRDATATHVVEHRHVFGEADRVVERQQRGRDHDRDLLSCARPSRRRAPAATEGIRRATRGAPTGRP